ncbi:hypothetical protein Tco_1432874, partial [Tanacetum coccineum]
SHSDIRNASSVDLSMPSCLETILRAEHKQLYPYVQKQIPINKVNILLNHDAIESTSASPEHNHATQRRLHTYLLTEGLNNYAS